MKKYKFTILILITFMLSYPFIIGKKVEEFKKDKLYSGSYSEEIGKDSKQQVEEEPENIEETNNDINETQEKEDSKKETEEIEKEEIEDSKVEKEKPIESEPPKEPENTASETPSQSCFLDALFIGDSRTVGLSEYADLEDADVFATTGLSVYKLFDTTVKWGDGKNRDLKTILQMKTYKHIYVMLGINELGYDFNQTVKKYSEIVDTIQSYQPDANYFLEANLHVSKRKSSSDSLYNNKNINNLNQEIKKIAEDKNGYYLDINEYFDDSEGNLGKEYTSDDAHVLGKYYQEWADWLKEHAKECFS